MYNFVSIYYYIYLIEPVLRNCTQIVNHNNASFFKCNSLRLAHSFYLFDADQYDISRLYSFYHHQGLFSSMPPSLLSAPSHSASHEVRSALCIAPHCASYVLFCYSNYSLLRAEVQLERSNTQRYQSTIAATHFIIFFAQ